MMKGHDNRHPALKYARDWTRVRVFQRTPAQKCRAGARQHVWMPTSSTHLIDDNCNYRLSNLYVMHVCRLFTRPSADVFQRRARGTRTRRADPAKNGHHLTNRNKKNKI